MARSLSQSKAHLKEMLGEGGAEEASRRMQPRMESLPKRLVGGARFDQESLDRRWDTIEGSSEARSLLADEATVADLENFQGNIEYLIGTVKVPVGIAGPLRVNGVAANADYYVPLATTEGALVASYCRGAALITDCGGCSAVLMSEGVVRAPGFAFNRAGDVGRFCAWIVEQMDQLKAVAAGTTNHGKLMGAQLLVEGNHIYVLLEYTTGDAAGQNMVTLATAAVCEWIVANTPVSPKYWFLEANASGDKKASFQSFISVRGKKVTAEVIVPDSLVSKRLHTTPQRMVEYWQMSSLGGVMSGTMGVQGHYANGLAALFIATGQDAACVAESAVGVTRYELTSKGDLYAAVTLPNLIVGTVGGGTRLPSQRACLELLGLAGTGKSAAFAELCGALALAGELSIIGALAAGDFAKAHKRYARGR